MIRYHQFMANLWYGIYSRTSSSRALRLYSEALYHKYICQLAHNLNQ